MRKKNPHLSHSDYTTRTLSCREWNYRQWQEKAVLLSSCDAKAYRLIRKLVSPGKITDKSLKELVTALSFTVAFDSMVNPYNGTSGNKKSVGILGNRDQLEPMLRDRLVCGVNYEVIQRIDCILKVDWNLTTRYGDGNSRQKHTRGNQKSHK